MRLLRKKETMSIWKIVMYSGIALVASASVYVGGFIHGNKVGEKDGRRKAQIEAERAARNNQRTDDVAQP